MSMLGSIIKTFLKSEIDSNVKKYISVLSGELDHKDLKLDLNVKLSDIEVKFTGTGLLANKEEFQFRSLTDTWFCHLRKILTP